MSRPPPISTRTDTLLPYPTFFRARLDLGGEQRPPERRRGLDGHGALHAVLAGVAGARHGAGVALPLDVGHVEPADARRVRRHRTEANPRLRALHGDDGPGGGDVLPAARRPPPVGLGGGGHDLEGLVVAPPPTDLPH